jgi:hypothetical protein
MMSESGEKYVPPEALDFSIKRPDESKLTEVGKRSVLGEVGNRREKPEPIGNTRNRPGLDGELITPEKTEKYHCPETTKELGVGDGPNPSWSKDPNDTTADDSVNADSDKE